jgi:MFS family permease
MMTPLIAADLGFTEAESALVLSGFFQGYTLTQVPAAPIVQRYGPKNVLSFSLLGTAALFAAAPALAGMVGSSARKATVLMLTFMTMGLVQGTLAPALSQVNRAWLPGGIEQVWALRAVSQAHQLTPLLAALITPRLAIRGWRLTCYVFAAATALFTVAWQLFASNAPRSTSGKVKPPATKKAVEWGIFRLPEAQAMTANWISFGLLNYSMLNLGPTFYMQKLGCSPLQWGAQLALVNSTSIPLNLLSGIFESVLLARGVAQLTIRRWNILGGAVGMGITSTMYGLSQSVLPATSWYLDLPDLVTTFPGNWTRLMPAIIIGIHVYAHMCTSEHWQAVAPQHGAS